MYHLFKCIKLFTLVWSEQMDQDIIDDVSVLCVHMRTGHLSIADGSLTA